MSLYNPHHPDAPVIFDAAQKFRQRCLLDQASLFLENESIWTSKYFDALISNYVKQPNAGIGGFYEKLGGQLATCNPLNVALMTEIFWIVQLAPVNLKPETKINRLEKIWNIKLAQPFPVTSPFLTVPVLSGLGSAGPGYNQYLWREMVFAIEAFATLAALPLNERVRLLSNGMEFANWLESIPSGEGRQLYHTLCHVLFPETFERIFSQGNKNQVARAHGIWKPALAASRPALDTALLDLRSRLEAQHPGEVDYYLGPVSTLARLAEAAGRAREQANNLAVEAQREELLQELDAYVVEPAADAVPTLRTTDNLILYGPPGTGKTFEMQRRMNSAFDLGENYTFVAFHPSYSYEDFVGGMRPVAANTSTGMVIKYVEGPFLEICNKAHSHPTEQFTLFIDEINRANVAKVFGELITLIESSKRVIAGSEFNASGAWVTIPGYAKPLGVPDNLNIVATMNTADRSISMMDVAMRRRFRFQECVPDVEQIEPAMIGNVDLRSLLRTLNDRLEYLLDRDHVIGHAFFMDLHSLDDLRAVLAERVLPLMQEYFFEDLDRVRIALTGSAKKSVFFNTRPLSPSSLFPGEKSIVGTESRLAFSVSARSSWSEGSIVGLYRADADQSPD